LSGSGDRLRALDGYPLDKHATVPGSSDGSRFKLEGLAVAAEGGLPIGLPGPTSDRRLGLCDALAPAHDRRRVMR